MAILFNTDYRPALEHYWNDFAGKMDRNAFIDMFVEYCEKVDHGFLLIVTDAPYDKKFYHGVAEILPINEDYICCCEEAWRENEQQMKEIKDGTMETRIEMINELTKLGEKPDVTGKRRRDDGKNFRPAWKLINYSRPLPNKFEKTQNREP